MTDKNKHNLLPGVPLIESPFFSPALFEDEKLIQVATNLSENGFAVIDFPELNFEEISANLIRRLSEESDWRAYREGIPVDMRIQDAWKSGNDDVRKLAVNLEIRGLLSALYGRTAIPFQTLNFPVGTQQNYHSDMVHFSSSPERFMCGVWIALEDVDADNGPLIYFPGSHKVPFYNNEQLGICVRDFVGRPTQEMYHEYWNAIVEKHDFVRTEFHAKKGQAAIWAANLLHGGLFNEKDRALGGHKSHIFFLRTALFLPQ